jgi:ribonuclease III
MDYTKITENIGYTFKNEDLLKEALTHRSYLNEHPEWRLPHNERMEFLGDAVLELVVTEELFNRYPDKEEGWMTSVRAALVNYQTLADVGRSVGIDSAVLLSRGESKDTGRAREVILANALESLIGAIYQDGGYPAARKFINQVVTSRLEDIIRNALHVDAKSQLQEKVQASLKVTPVYKVISSEGPDHKKVFTIGVYFGDKLVAQGNGPSKQDGEVEAARKALAILEEGRKPIV